MGIHIFAQNGHESRVFAIEAENETMARGIAQEKTHGKTPPYKGTLDELMDDDCINLTHV